MPEEANQEPAKPQNILDAVSFSKQSDSLRSFNPQGIVLEYLAQLDNREKQILMSRYGLEDGKPQTLENIGKKLNLTRERVRQIEKDSLKRLRLLSVPSRLNEANELIFQIIEDLGDIAPETKILETLLVNNASDLGSRSILFILNVNPRFNPLRENVSYHQSWSIIGFDQEVFENIIAAAIKLLETEQKPMKSEEMYRKLSGELDIPEAKNISNEVLENYISISKGIGKNAFQEWGLTDWTQIHPKDVGDKIYLVLQHHGKPEHYGKITELINKHSFDKRTAHKETVHNELIKDQRFVLVGRGIYALREWGYKKGVVADIIKEILNKSDGPLTRDQIIDEVLKQRFVKRNTIIVGLSNRKLFAKTPDNKYTNA